MPIIEGRRRINPLDSNKNVRIGVAFPLNETNLFQGTQTFKEQVKTNLINVLLTEPGERINEPNFGVGLKGLLFEQNINKEGLDDVINQQINFYIPQIELVETVVMSEEHTISIKLTYKFLLDNTNNAVQLNFNSNDVQ
tara:strand:+ start:56 stop:472 length:417 start_codon:yes stop_codon:yes gene_type:complete